MYHTAFDSVDRVALWRHYEGLVCHHFFFNSYVTCTQEQLLVFALLRVCQMCFTQHQESVKVVYLLLRFFAVQLIGSCDTVLSGYFGVDLGNFHLTDINYTDGTVLTNDPTKWDYVFLNFEASADVMGLHTNWHKMKIQNIWTGDAATTLTIKQ